MGAHYKFGKSSKMLDFADDNWQETIKSLRIGDSVRVAHERSISNTETETEVYYLQGQIVDIKETAVRVSFGKSGLILQRGSLGRISLWEQEKEKYS